MGQLTAPSAYQSYDALRLHGDARDSASVASDGVSAVRNTVTSISSSIPGAAVAGATATAALKVLGGPLLVGIGAYMLRDTHYKVAEARACGHTEGVARHVLYGSMGASLAALGGMMTTDALAALINLSPSANIVLPAAMGAIALPAAVIAMYASQLIYSVHGLVIGSKFASELERQTDPYKWLLDQVTVLGADKVGTKLSEDQILSKKQHSFELRVSDNAKELLLSVDKLVNSDKVLDNLKKVLKSYAVEKVKEANYKKKVTNYLLLLIAIVGVALGALLLTNPVGWLAIAIAVASAVLAVAWLSIDSKKLNTRFCDWRWKAQGIHKATDALKALLASKEDQEEVKKDVGEKFWNSYLAGLVDLEQEGVPLLLKVGH